MKLYICEKPSQARDLARNLNLKGYGYGFIGNDNKAITWAYGHLVQQLEPNEYDEKYKRWNLADLPIIPDNWKMKPNPIAKKQLKIVGSLLKKSNHVLIATDGDREGETIGRELLDYFNWSGKIERLWLTALDDKSIKKALNNILPGEKTKALYYAGLGRSRADWIVGMNATRALTIKSNQGTLSAGRVQTPTLAIIVNRDLAIENFKPKDFFDIMATFNGFVTKWKPNKNIDKQNRCINKDYANEV